MKHTLTSVFALALVFAAAPSVAQDDDGGPQTWGDDAKYMTVTYVKFKAGKRADAMQIIGEHFMPAGKAAGLPPPFAFHYQTGKWDASFWWDLENGLKDLEWFISPNNIKFMASLAEQEGSMEAAEELFAKYRSMIANSLVDIGHYHDPGDDGDGD